MFIRLMKNKKLKLQDLTYKVLDLNSCLTSLFYKNLPIVYFNYNKTRSQALRPYIISLTGSSSWGYSPLAYHVWRLDLVYE